MGLRNLFTNSWLFYQLPWITVTGPKISFCNGMGWIYFGNYYTVLKRKLFNRSKSRTYILFLMQYKIGHLCNIYGYTLWRICDIATKHRCDIMCSQSNIWHSTMQHHGVHVPNFYELSAILVQGGHIPAEIKCPVFSLCYDLFPCVFFHKINRWFWVIKDFPGL